MSFNPFSFDASIYTRLVSTTSGLVQGVWNTQAPPGIKLTAGGAPYVIMELINGTFDPTTFSVNIAEATYRVSVYDHDENGLVPSHTIISRIFRDSEGTDNAPSTGLARWKIPAVTDVATALLRPEEFGTQHSEGVLHHFMTFSIEVQEA